VSTSPEKERLTVELFEGDMEVDADKNEGSSTQSQEIEKPEDNNLEKMANEGEADDFDVTKLRNPFEALKSAREERRWSERVQEIAAKKNKKDIFEESIALKGNTITSNSFSALSNDEIIDRSMNMGVLIDKNNTIVISMLLELELARQAHCDKARNGDADMIKNINAELYVNGEISESENLDLENESILEEPQSESDGFSLIIAKRVRKATQRLSLSRKATKTKRSKKVNKGAPCVNGGGDEENQGALDVLTHTPVNKKKGRKK
jgi:hypothetical protein